MPDTVDTLRAEHGNMVRALDLLERQIALIEAADEPDYDLIGQIIDYFRRFPDLYHHPKEELILARLKARAPDEAERIGDLESEHEGCSQHLQDFARTMVKVLLGSEIPRDDIIRVAREFIANERAHMRGEEEVFFPTVLEHLTDEDWRSIDEKARRFKDPLLDAQGPFNFELLAKHLH